MAKYLLALDQGTTSSRCILFDKGGSPVRSAQIETARIYPRPGWVEQDPLEIWSSQSAAMAQVLAALDGSAADIAAIGIANQRETVVLWERRNGRPIANAISWQCRRTSDRCDELRRRGLEKSVREKTGLVIDAYFSATKIRWLLDNVPGARAGAERGDVLFGTVDSWLLWHLTGGKVHATDCSNASRTMLFNIHTLDWDDEILRELGIPRAMLPEVLPSSRVYGLTSPAAVGCEIPIAGLAGDQQAALFGQGCHESGMAKNTYGTGCFILMHTGDRAIASQNGLLTTIAWRLGDRVEYALEGSVFTAGAAIQWLRDGLRLIDDASASETFARRVPDANGVYMVPAFAGLGAPHWDQDARGAILGLTAGTTREHFIRAALEALAYQSHDVIQAMEADAGISLKSLRADGGASVNDLLMQFQADILNVEVVRPAVVESTALGAALLAGLGVGFYSGLDDIARNRAGDRTFTPSLAPDRRQALLGGWREAVRRCLGQAKSGQGETVNRPAPPTP